jgi:hypothetical protein
MGRRRKEQLMALAIYQVSPCEQRLRRFSNRSLEQTATFCTEAIHVEFEGHDTSCVPNAGHEPLPEAGAQRAL